MAIPTPVSPTSTEPTDLPRWASTDIANGPGGANNVIEPSEAKKDIGWNVGERPPREYMNWFQRVTYLWTLYLDSWIDFFRNAMPPVAENWGIDPATTAGLTFGFKSGRIRMKTDLGTEVIIGTAAGTVALTDASTNTVYFDQSAGTVAATVSYTPDRDRIALYTIVTAAGAIDWASSNDLRTPHQLFTPATFGGAAAPGYVPDPVSESSRVLLDTGAWAVAQSLIAIFAGAGVPGLVPDPGTENGDFLRDDGTWAQPTAATPYVLGIVVDSAGNGVVLPAGWSSSIVGSDYVVNFPARADTNYSVTGAATGVGGHNNWQLNSRGLTGFTYRGFNDENGLLAIGANMTFVDMNGKT